MFADSEGYGYQTNMPETQDVGVDVSWAWEMQNEGYDIQNDVLSEGDDDQVLQNADLGTLVQGELTRYLRTLLKP